MSCVQVKAQTYNGSWLAENSVQVKAQTYNGSWLTDFLRTVSFRNASVISIQKTLKFNLTWSLKLTVVLSKPVI